MYKYCLVGAGGKLGSSINKILPDAVCSKVLRTLNQKKNYFSDKSKAIELSKVVIDVSTTSSALATLNICIEKKVPILIGVTGFNSRQLNQIKAASEKIPVMLASNFSPLVNLLQAIVKKYSPVLADLETQVEIVETHRTDKKDKPSGTALDIAKAITNNSNFNTAKITSLREGEHLGAHKIVFSSKTEEIYFGHTTKNRENYAFGAVRAANYLINQKQPQLYAIEQLMIND